MKYRQVENLLYAVNITETFPEMKKNVYENSV